MTSCFNTQQLPPPPPPSRWNDTVAILRPRRKGQVGGVALVVQRCHNHNADGVCRRGLRAAGWKSDRLDLHHRVRRIAARRIANGVSNTGNNGRGRGVWGVDESNAQKFEFPWNIGLTNLIKAGSQAHQAEEEGRRRRSNVQGHASARRCRHVLAWFTCLQR